MNIINEILAMPELDSDDKRVQVIGVTCNSLELGRFIINQINKEKKLKAKLREYLAMPSADGRLIRREMRKELAEMIK